MELQTGRQVSLDYGISNRMLRYYEQIGLIESSRIDDYAYRMYDEANIKRLQQIIILRKLQIPMKQIKDILNNQDAVAVIEIFEQNINELDEQIIALSTVKSILSRFVDELQEKADVHLKLDLLNDKTMIAVVNSLSFSENKIKEKVSMEELNRANEVIDKLNDGKVRVVYRPPATIAYLFYSSSDPDEKTRKVIDAKLKKFIKDTDLFNLKPDMRVFTYGGGDRDRNENIWVTIPDDLDVPAPFVKKIYPGGLYVACAGSDIGRWLENHDEYEWHDSNGRRAIGDEYFNPYNIYGLEENNSDDIDYSYVTELFPIRKVKKITDSEKEKINAELDKIVPRGKPVEIDLMSMILQVEDGVVHELNYLNGLIELKRDDGWHTCGMLTQQQFNYPLKIELRAKTDKGAINISFAQISVGLNSARTYQLDIGENGSWQAYRELGKIPVDEFFNVELILTKEGIAVKVNGELRYYGSEYEYIKKCEENPEYSLSGTIFVSGAWGATITVESLRVTEL